MTPERWKRISGLFAEALELPREQRSAYLNRACADAPDDKREVEQLIRRYENTPAFESLTHCSGRPANHVEERSLVGTKVGVYEIVEEIGRGGMGVVYRAHDTRLDRFVALKTLPAAWAADVQRRERLRQEAKAAAALTHKGIAAVYDYQDEGEFPYIVSEFVKGRSLRARLADGPLRRQELFDLACEISDALAAAHAQGVVHRDLKPDNVLLPETGGCKIVDFGLAQFQSPLLEDSKDRLTKTGTLVGTPAYMAPEQIRGRHDARSDVFAFGVTMVEAATAEHPFAADTPHETLLRVAEEEIDFAPLDDLGCRALVPVLRRCTAKDPAARYPSAREVSGALAAVREMDRLHARDHDQDDDGKARRWLAWWRVHQVVVSAVCTLTLWPIYAARPLLTAPALMFFSALVPAIVVVCLRLFFLYVSELSRRTLGEELRRWGWLLRTADLAFVAASLAVAVGVSTKSVRVAAFFLTVSLGLALSSLIIEPRTTAGALAGCGDRETHSRRRSPTVVAQGRP